MSRARAREGGRGEREHLNSECQAVPSFIQVTDPPQASHTSEDDHGGG